MSVVPSVGLPLPSCRAHRCTPSKKKKKNLRCGCALAPTVRTAHGTVSGVSVVPPLALSFLDTGPGPPGGLTHPTPAVQRRVVRLDLPGGLATRFPTNRQPSNSTNSVMVVTMTKAVATPRSKMVRRRTRPPSDHASAYDPPLRPRVKCRRRPPGPENQPTCRRVRSRNGADTMNAPVSQFPDSSWLRRPMATKRRHRDRRRERMQRCGVRLALRRDAQSPCEGLSLPR